MTYEPKTEQFSHQRKVLDDTWDQPGYAIWWEQGTGKSKALIDNGGKLFAEGAIDGIFVLAPNGLHRNFVTKEIPKHLPDGMAEDAKTMFWRTEKAGTKWHQEAARSFVEDKKCGIKVLTMSFDGIMTDAGRAVAKEFLTTHRCLYGVDESGRIKEPKADRTKRVLASASFAPFRRVMTGTPIANAPWDAYTQIKFVDDNFWRGHGLDSPEAMRAQFGVWEKGARRVHPAQARWPSGKLKFFKYPPGFPDSQKSEYVLKDGLALLRFPKQVQDDDGRPQFKNLDRLREILSPIRSRVLKKDVFDLPPKVYTPLEFDLSTKQRAAYDSLEKLGFTKAGERFCSTSLALTVMLRLQQIACGYIVADLEPGDEDPVVIPIDPNPRLELLSEVVADLDHQAIIWARFTPDIDFIMERLAKMGKTAVRYDGKVGDDERAENEDMFHAGAAQFFVAKASTGGEGLTLNEAKTHIYYSNTFKLIERLQSEDRSHRWGQDTKVNYIDLMARDTVDERIIFALQNKLDVASAVTGDSLKEWIRRVDRLL
jgi:hypothetical protein